MANFENVTVITVTRGRPYLLKNAIESVKKQNYPGVIKHFIYIDDCKDTLEFVKENYKDDESVDYYFYHRNEKDVSGPSLLARLRNDAVYKCKTEWFSFLDDDNLYCEDHLKNLMDFAIQQNCEAVFSNSRIFYRDETPYIKKQWQWERDPEKGKEKWKQLETLGVVVEGSNEIHFQYGIIIDTNVWLVKRELLLKFPISDYFSEQDWINNLAEDDKMMLGFYENNVRVLGNNKPTVKYYLGGYSNVFDGSEKGTIIWKKTSNN